MARQLLTFAVLFALCGTLRTAEALRTTPSSAVTYDTKLEEGLSFKMSDNVVLHGDGSRPLRPAGDNSTLFPVILFPNSWGMPQYEYVTETLNFAPDGYLTIEYETRGWYLSGGEIDTAGPLDISDASTVLTQILDRAEEWHLNTSAIAFAGISYGAGISLAVAGVDDRVTTAVVLSGWNNLTDCLYQYNTPNLVWGELLVGLADIVGHPNSTLSEYFNDLLAHAPLDMIPVLLNYTEKRSPGIHLDHLNAKKVPLFISSNFLDRLFRPQHMMHFFEKLQGPKMLLLNQGIHAEPEALEMFGLAGNYIWRKAKLWLDHFLMGRNNGITDEPKVQMEIGGNDLFDRDRVMFNTWPASPTESRRLKYYFTPRLNNKLFDHYGSLSTTAPTPSSDVVDDITYSELPGLTSGLIPVVSDLLSTVGFPVRNELPLTDKTTSLIFMGEPLDMDRTFCGTPKVNLSLDVPMGQNWQIDGYMYEVDGLGNGILLSDMAYSNYADGNVMRMSTTTSGRVNSKKQERQPHTDPAVSEAKSYMEMLIREKLGIKKVERNGKTMTKPATLPQRKEFAKSFFRPNVTRLEEMVQRQKKMNQEIKTEEIQKKEAETPSSRTKVGTTVRTHLEDIMFHSFCRRISKGQRLAVGFALYNNLYKMVNTQSGWKMTFVYDDFPSSVEFPHVL